MKQTNTLKRESTRRAARDAEVVRRAAGLVAQFIRYQATTNEASATSTDISSISSIAFYPSYPHSSRPCPGAYRHLNHERVPFPTMPTAAAQKGATRAQRPHLAHPLRSHPPSPSTNYNSPPPAGPPPLTPHEIASRHFPLKQSNPNRRTVAPPEQRRVAPLNISVAKPQLAVYQFHAPSPTPSDLSTVSPPLAVPATPAPRSGASRSPALASPSQQQPTSPASKIRLRSESLNYSSRNPSASSSRGATPVAAPSGPYHRSNPHSPLDESQNNANGGGQQHLNRAPLSAGSSSSSSVSTAPRPGPPRTIAETICRLARRSVSPLFGQFVQAGEE
ncbi:hypothetical protein BDK51DRAFT_48910 [Blyttiomyces helicus]|uniref:Uncharacterized protein n=1 Tax=Blyttiomyces helicus TaxID=388810 RepID=A0A4P9W365_9FUNG|nr:hypothetical protein BDK51DRAFT_48910 [Blyttiomyces helicus]|eukprot:RKO84536.1 hypothetical protein BDK51DRAFT_48910 [Blyttiomyces helicus]